MGHRSGAVFVRDWRQHSRPMSRDERVRIFVVAEGLERRSKAPGARGGALGYIGIAVLRALLFTYLNCGNGMCCPSYDALQRTTGLARASIAKALDRLERTGIVRIVRRLCRQRVGERVLTTMATSLYSFWQPMPQFTVKGATTNTSARKSFPRRRSPQWLGSELALLLGSSVKSRTLQIVTEELNAEDHTAD